MEVIQSWPPVTRVLVITTVVLSVLIHSQLISAYRWVFLADYAFQLPPKIPEVWRVLTAFCITGESFGILMDSYFLYTYSSGLELHSPRFIEHGSYFIYMVSQMSIITILGGYYLGGFVLLKALIVSLAYTFSQDNPNSNVTMFVLSFPAKYLPYAILGLTVVSGGIQGALVEATGLLAAHMYDFLTRIWPQFGGGRNLLPTPQFVKNWFAPTTSSSEARGYGRAYRPAGQAPSAPSAGWTNQRGPGRRLGD